VDRVEPEGHDAVGRSGERHISRADWVRRTRLTPARPLDPGHSVRRMLVVALRPAMVDDRVAGCQSHAVKSCGPSGSQDLAFEGEGRPPPSQRGGPPQPVASGGRHRPYHGTSQATGGSQRQQVSLVSATSALTRFAADCHRLHPRGSIKAPSFRCRLWLRGMSGSRLRFTPAWPTSLADVTLCPALTRPRRAATVCRLGSARRGQQAQNVGRPVFVLDNCPRRVQPAVMPSPV
jgi:hypothetical protein